MVKLRLLRLTERGDGIVLLEPLCRQSARPLDVPVHGPHVSYSAVFLHTRHLSEEALLLTYTVLMKRFHFFLFALILWSTAGAHLVCAQNDVRPIGNHIYTLIAEHGIDEAIATYRQLKAEQADAYDFSFAQLEILGRRLQGEGQLASALRIFELNVEVYPELIVPRFGYAQALQQNGEREAAIAMFEHGLRLLEGADNIPADSQRRLKAIGESQIQVLRHFNQSDEPKLTYVADFGGSPAGQWDVEHLAAFQEKQGHIDINYQSNDFYRAPVPFFVHERFKPGQAPDVASGFVKGVYRDYIAEGRLVDLSELWDEQGWDEAFPASIKKAVSYEGKPYFVPITFQWNPIWYRTDVFEKLGLTPPETWDELLTLCETLHEAGYVPFTVSAQGWVPPVARWFAILTLRLHGPDFYEVVMKGEIAWTDARVKEVFEHWQALFDHHAFAAGSANNGWGTAVQDLATANAAMWNIGEWMFEASALEAKADSLDFFPMPPINPAMPKAELFHLYGAHQLTGSPNPENAEAFLQSIGSEAVQRSNHTTLTSRTPAHQGAYDQLSPSQKRQYDYIRTVDHLAPLFEFNTHPEMAQAAFNQFLAFWRNPSEIDPVLQKLEEARQNVFQP